MDRSTYGQQSRVITGVTATVNAQGFRETYAALRKIDPVLYGKTNSRIRSAIAPMRSEARQRYQALASWEGSTPAAHLADIAKGVKIKRGRRGRRYWYDRRGNRRVRAQPLFSWMLSSESKYGAMTELAAQGHDPRGRTFVDALNRHTGAATPGRFMYPAVDAHRVEVTAQVASLVRATEREFDRRLNTGAYAGKVTKVRT